MPTRVLLLLVMGCALLAGSQPESSRAAEISASVALSPGTSSMSGLYVAGPGESNDVTVTSVLADGVVSGFRVHDPGATITAGLHCVSLDPATAECVTPGCALRDPVTAQCVERVWGLSGIRVELGDGDDVLQAMATSTRLNIDGGPGDDRLLGGSSWDQLNGGGGVDELHGNAGDDLLVDGDSDLGQRPDADVLDGGKGEDTVSYESRTTPVIVDLADPAPDGARGERDELVDIEGVHGGSGDDRLSGDASANQFDDEGGTNEFRGRGGDDYFWGARAGSIDCGTGNDRVVSGGRGAGSPGITRRVVLASNCETLSARRFGVRAYPRQTRTGLAFDFTGDPPKTMTVREAAGRRRTLARGPIRSTNVARLRVTTLGWRLLRRRRVAATVHVPAEPKVAWDIVLPRRGT